jgi:hypothetical protein
VVFDLSLFWCVVFWVFGWDYKAWLSVLSASLLFLLMCVSVSLLPSLGGGLELSGNVFGLSLNFFGNCGLAFWSPDVFFNYIMYHISVWSFFLFLT